MSLFSSIPVRGPSDIPTYSWWNTIRTKLIEFAGGGVTAEDQFDVTDNASGLQLQDSGGNAFTLDSSTYSVYHIEYMIYRTDASTPRRESGRLVLTYDDANTEWDLHRETYFGDALNDGINSIQVDGNNIDLSSDSMGGTYAGYMRWKVVQTIDKEET